MVKRMAKYINTDVLEAFGFTDQEGSFSDGVQWLLEYIDALPSADVQPVRHGRWTLQEDRTKKLFGWYICSECGAWIGEPTNYCSNCGADMRGEQNG